MDLQKVVKVSRKLSAIVNKEFPFIDECDAREEIAKVLINLHFEPKIMPKLFSDQWELPIPRKNNDDDLV